MFNLNVGDDNDDG